MNDRDFALRPEAGPVPYCSLIKSQRDALERILKALDEARQQLGPHPYRMSRIFFVSGEPGSGKSSLFYTLREILSGEQPSWKPWKTYKEKYGGLIGRLAPCVRWLDLIDLEVAGDKGENLLAAVLVRIARALENLSGAGSTACQDAMNQLEVLANDIGIAWDGNLRARASSLDPDSYSQEVMRAQRARLGVNERLSNALNKLSDGKCYGCSKETLFVLPVDDFYLKPAVSLELLRLLQMISVPRLFFLIMGDEKTMQALFLEKALADWTAIAGPQVFGALEERQQEVLSRAREMSARYFRKLLPAGQRAELDVMTWQKALQYKPPLEIASPKVAPLWELLLEVDIRKAPRSENAARTEASNLLDFLITKNAQKLLESETDGAGSEENESDGIEQLKEPYSAHHILEAGPREVMDLWKSIQELTKTKRQCSSDNQTPAYLDKIFQIAIRSIEEQDFLTEKQQELLRFAFPTAYDAGPVETDRLQLETKVSKFTKSSSAFGPLWVRKHFGWTTRVTDNGVNKDDKSKGERKGSGAFSHLPPRQSAWIILLHDLSVIWNPENITDNLAHKVSKSLNEIHREPELRDHGWVWCQHKEVEEKELKWSHFPLPDLNTFRQLDRFLTVWSCGLSKEPQNWQYLVGLWIHAGRIARGSDDLYDDKNFKIDEKDSVIDGSERSWGEILEKIKNEFEPFPDSEERQLK